MSRASALFAVLVVSSVWAAAAPVTEQPFLRPHTRSLNKLRKDLLSQDAGAAIDGPGKVDLFWGAGLRASAEASRMKASGRLFFLLLKSKKD